MNKPDLSKIPSMTALLKAAESAKAFAEKPASLVADALREAVALMRADIMKGLAGSAVSCEIAAVLDRAASLLRVKQATRLVRVINATGVVLHTGLGRSVLADEAVERITQVARGYCSLEIVMDSGQRGKRGSYVEQLLCRLTGAEAAFVVNNNAAATMMVLHGLAKDREVIVSRGQLIEIGGSYRLPEVMSAGGAILREVGTTNKTHLRDYEDAICDKTAMIMHVHTSNYRVVGFTETPGVPELVQLARRHKLPMFDDLGSGAILADDVWAAADEPTVYDSLRHGADFVSFSGDKLLGGPQAGILLGKKAIIDALRRDPMARALRIDKLTIAALEATLELYLTPEAAKRRIPLLASLCESIDVLRQRAEALAAKMKAALPGDAFEVAEDESFAGGGSLPAWPFPTAVVRWRAGGASLDELARRLRVGEPAVLPRIKDDAIVFDLRTLPEREFDELCAAACKARE